MARHVLAEVEARFNAPMKSILEGLVEEGLNKETAAKRLGITKNTLLRWIKNNDIDWPLYTLEHARNRGNKLRERSIYIVEHRGQEKPLFDAAKEEGLAFNVVLERYKKGDRGRRLFRKVRKYRKPPEQFNLDVSVQEWKVACELAREIGTKRAAQKLGLPMSALTIALKGRLEQLG